MMRSRSINGLSNRLSVKLWVPALLGMLAIAGCSGTQLGDTLGKNLEPDPQLSEGNNPTDSSANPPSPTPATPDPNKADAVTPSPAPTDPKVIAGEYSDLGKAPEEIQPYLVDLIKLNLLKVRPTTATTSPSSSPSPAANGTATSPTPNPTPVASPPGPDEFRPNQAILRREYARWLLATNNRFYDSQRTRKIRPGVTSSTPVFQDVKASDPDFAAIQGLAEAGIIPSPLTGSSTALTFRPNAPLTRKDLLLWKVPLDTRQPLPQATIAAVEQAWGFQDASKIEPRALQALLADYQNGDFANIRRAFSYTTLFQPDKAATRAEAAAVLWRFGNSTEGITAAEVLNPGAAGADQNNGQSNSQSNSQSNGQSSTDPDSNPDAKPNGSN